MPRATRRWPRSGAIALHSAALLALAACSDAPSAVDGGSSSASTVTLPNSAQTEQIVPGEILIGVESDDDVDAIGRTHGLSIARRGYRNAFVVLRGAAGTETAMAARLRGDPRVRYAEPNYLRQPTVDGRLWGFFNDGSLRLRFTSGTSTGSVVTSALPTSDADVDANGATEANGAGGAEVLIGSLDTGVDFGHPEFLAGTLIAGWDWVDNDNNPTDDDDHGTHTTGTMAGATVGVAGVSGANSASVVKVKVYVQRVCGALGCPTSAIVSAIRAAADQPNLVAMNLSLGGRSISTAEQDAIAYATSRNVLVIASSGNDGTTTVSCPACDPRAISVAALNWSGALSYYSNRGSGLDISAPGGEMYSNTTADGGIYSAVRGGLYAYFQGTSMAAPMVTGIAGVLASKTGLRGPALRDRLTGSVDDLGVAGYDTQFGAGRVNLAKALAGGSGGGGGAPATTVTISKSCANATCTLTGTTNQTTPTWAWRWNNSAATSSSATITRTFTAAGSSVASLTVTGSGGSATATATVSCRTVGKTLRCS